MILMNQTIMISKRSSANEYGEYTYTDQYATCRLEMRQIQFRTRDGRTLLSTGILYIKEQLVIGDRITYEDVQYNVGEVYDNRDLAGHRAFFKVYLI